MKKIWIFAIASLFFVREIRAQFDLLTYDFRRHPAAVFSDPASGQARFWLVTPLIPQTQFQVKLSGPTAYDLFAADGRDFNDKWRQALENIRPSQGLLLENKNLWLAAGWRKDEQAFRLGLYTQFHVWAFHPVSFYRLALYGNLDRPGEKVYFRELNFNTELVHVLFAGWAKNWPSGWKTGINFKIYNSAGNISSYGNSGTFYYEPSGQNNYYTHVVDRINLQVHSSGLGRLILEDKAGQSSVNEAAVRRDIIDRLNGTNNWGLGVDLGFRKPLDARWEAALSIEDLGFIRYADDNYSLYSHGSYRYEGINVIFPENPVDYWGQVRDDFKEKVPTDTLRAVFFKMRPFKLYTSLRYTFPGRKINDYACYRPGRGDYDAPGKPHSYAGIVLFYQNLQGKPYWGAGAYLQWVTARWLQFRLTYGSDAYIKHNIGLGVQWHIGPWHAYLMADNLLGYTNLAASHGQYIGLGTYWAF